MPAISRSAAGRMRRALAVTAGAAAVVAVAAPGVGAGAAAGAAGLTMSGVVTAGSRPVPASRIVLYSAGSGAPMRLGAAWSGPNGRFRISYPRTRGVVLYVVASGTSRPAGRALELVSVAGTASAPDRSVRVNELTTVGSAYALNQFAHGSVIGGPAPGFANAAATATSLINPATGGFGAVVARRPNGGQTTTQATLGTLANLVGACAAGGPVACARVFAAARPAGDPAPGTTLDAVLDIARNPARRTAALFALATPSTVSPHLSAPPSSWVLSLLHTAGGFNGPGRMAFDSRGDVWVSNNFAPGTRDEPGLGLISLGPTGAPINGSPIAGGGLMGVWWGIAVDQHNRIWTSNYTGSDPTPFYDPGFVGGHTVSAFNDRGVPISPTGYTQGEISGPQGIAVDQRGNVWIANHTNDTVTEYPYGDPTTTRVIHGGGLSKPFAIAIDRRGNVWVDDNAIDRAEAGQLTRISPDGVAHGPIAVGALSSPQGMAFDQSGNLWVANLGSSSVTELRSDGRVLHRIRSRSLVGPWSVAVDGAGNVWVASFLRGSLTEICGAHVAACPPGTHTGQAISPVASGFTNGGLQHLTAVQVDESGNLWVANNWRRIAPPLGGDGLVEFVGTAPPVRTPLIGPPQRP
jgi:hypothetical protein